MIIQNEVEKINSKGNKLSQKPKGEKSPFKKPKGVKSPFKESKGD
jgi:hypothetical protein